ncbi:hypothetical protein EDD86DRAFT_248626 [Gorgonomyces haynaldii]|nr:hypothetical protein EDD86DRAFT_248626 [Gorgonomyces haynaldii]
MPPPPPNTALLQSIQKGAKLKKTVTNDRTKPSKTVESRNGPSSYEPSGAPQLGGLFAGGMPKLKPAGFKPQQPVNHLQPPQPGIKKSASGPIPQEDKKPQERSSVIGRPAPPVPQARQAPPVPQPRQAPPPPARTSVTAPPVQPVQQMDVAHRYSATPLMAFWRRTSEACFKATSTTTFKKFWYK